MMRMIAMISVLLLAAAGCAPRTAEVEGEPAGAQGDVFADPAAFRGRTVRVEGVFQGHAAAECRFAPAARAVSLTRSDWLVRRGASCLYVTGGIPSGLDPFDAAAAGRPLDLHATVIADPEGRYLLQLRDVPPR